MKKFAKLLIIMLFLIIGFTLATYLYFNLPYRAKGEKKLVYINKDEKTFRNTYNDREYIAMSILEDNRLGLVARTKRDYKYFMIWISNPGEDEALIKEEDRIEDGKIEALLDLDLAPGIYDVKVFLGKEFIKDKDLYINYDLDIKTSINKNKDIKFLRGKMLKYNLDQMKKGNAVKRKHLSLLKYSKEELAEYEKILDEILSGRENLDDYEKAFLISQYISDKIYYDYDALRAGNYKEGSAYEAYLSEKAVCQGYAALTEVLLRLANIPVRQTIGYGLGGSGIEAESWDSVGDTSNHVWNEAFINDRWIIIDSTWNSRNRYENGEYKKFDNLTSYFDQTLEFFSENYRIDKRL